MDFPQGGPFDMLTAEQRSRRARIAALSQHAAGRTNTVIARAALFRRFEDEVDPDRVLPEAERKRRAEFAKRAHYERVTFKRLETLRRKRARRPAEEAAA